MAFPDSGAIVAKLSGGAGVADFPSRSAELLVGLGQSGPLVQAQLDGDTSSGIGKVVQVNRSDMEAPLWFYTLKGTELLGTSPRVGGSERRHRLGVLGNLIVAESLVGLIDSDAESHWSAQGGPWNPAMAASGGTPRIDSMEAMLRAAGLL